MDNKDLKNAFNQIAIKLYDSIYQDVDSAKVQELLSNPKLDWTNPERISCLCVWDYEKLIRAVLMQVYPNIPDRANRRRLEFLYFHYEYLSCQLKRVVDLGMGGSADKARWILRQYHNSILGNDVQEIPIDNKGWSHPDFGTTAEWLEYVEVLYNAYYNGFTPNNIEVLKKINDASVEHRGGNIRW